VKSGFFFASKRNEIFASISNFASEAKVRAHPKMDPTNSPEFQPFKKTFVPTYVFLMTHRYHLHKKYIFHV
jgi:hypothetical protein